MENQIILESYSEYNCQYDNSYLSVKQAVKYVYLLGGKKFRK